jgi:SinI restriction endonuclease
VTTQILELAKTITEASNQTWDLRLETIIRFCAASPDLEAFPKLGKKAIDLADEESSSAYLKSYISRYFADRQAKLLLKEVGTTADPAVDVILQAFANLKNTEEVSNHHRKAMAAENLLGSLLERYLAENLEPHGWVWCAGNTVRAIDFLTTDLTTVLQVKNRDNSENSSSSAIRHGTTIKKWFRVFSATGKTNWTAFPANLPKKLSEEGFYEYIEKYAKNQ